MMGRQTGDQRQLFYLFNLEGRIPARHLLRRINPIVTSILLDLRGKLERFYSELGRPSIDPELMLRMLIVSYCYGIRRAEAVRGGRVAPGLSLVLPVGS
jgi:transposase